MISPAKRLLDCGNLIRKVTVKDEMVIRMMKSEQEEVGLLLGLVVYDRAIVGIQQSMDGQQNVVHPLRAQLRGRSDCFKFLWQTSAS
jgi:hypothetical protein